MKRYDCLKAIAPIFTNELVVTSVGAVRAEWHSLRPSDANLHLSNLGLASSVGLGLALTLPHRKVVVFDGDGSVLANLASLTTIANQNPKNLVHIVFDNSAYESSKGLQTATSGVTDLALMAKGAGIKNSYSTDNLEEFESLASAALRGNDVTFILAKVEYWAANVPPTTFDALEKKYKFIRHIEETEKISIQTVLI